MSVIRFAVYSERDLSGSALAFVSAEATIAEESRQEWVNKFYNDSREEKGRF
jgi:hypothetical protein